MLPLVLAAALASGVSAAPPALPALPPGLWAPGGLAVEAPPVGGVPAVRGVAAAAVVRLYEAPPSRGSEVVRVSLSELFNRHLKNAESFGQGEDRFFLSTQLSLKGDAFLAVQGTDWPEPIFYEFASGMEGSWRGGRSSFQVSLDGSIFRRRFNNFLVITEGQDEKQVYKRRLSDFFYSAYRTGQDVAVGGRLYKIFVSYGIDTSRSPAVFDKDTLGICLLYDASTDADYHDFKSFPIPGASVKVGEPAAFRLQGGQVLFFQFSEDKKTLIVSD